MRRRRLDQGDVDHVHAHRIVVADDEFAQVQHANHYYY